MKIINTKFIKDILVKMIEDLFTAILISLIATAVLYNAFASSRDYFLYVFALGLYWSSMHAFTGLFEKAFPTKKTAKASMEMVAP